MRSTPLMRQRPPDMGGFYIDTDTKDAQDVHDKTATFKNYFIIF